jgi:hypothetical protein
MILLIDLEITENILKSKTAEKDVMSVLFYGKVILQFSLASANEAALRINPERQ